MRQQRTSSRNRPNPGVQPTSLPVLLGYSLTGDAGLGNLTLVFTQPVALTGIPALTSQEGGQVVGAEQTSETTVRLDWLGPASAGTWIELGPWDGAIRGYNGEWVRSNRVLVGGGADGAFPKLITVSDVFCTDSTTAIWTLSEAATVQSPNGLLINGMGGIGLGAGSANTQEVFYAGPIGLGSIYSVEVGWNPTTYTPEGWLANGPGICSG